MKKVDAYQQRQVARRESHRKLTQVQGRDLLRLRV